MFESTPRAGFVMHGVKNPIIFGCTSIGFETGISVRNCINPIVVGNEVIYEHEEDVGGFEFLNKINHVYFWPTSINYFTPRTFTPIYFLIRYIYPKGFMR